MNIVRCVAAIGTVRWECPFSLLTIPAVVSCSSEPKSSGSGSFWYSAQKAASSVSLRFMACCTADISS